MDVASEVERHGTWYHVLELGDVVTVEPGVYRKDFGGVRLEDLVVVTDGQPDVLTQFDYELEIRP